MERRIDGYKLWGHARTPVRRETEKGAISLAEKLKRQGKHGIIERVEVDENGIHFVQIGKF